MRSLRRVAVVLLTVLGASLLAACDPTPVATFLVQHTSDAPDTDPGDGQCLSTEGECTLRAAVMEANVSPGIDEIVLEADTLYELTIGGTGEDASVTGDLDVTDSLILTGNGSTVDGTGTDRVLHLHAVPQVILKDLTITGGKTSDDGGGVLNEGAQVELRDSTVTGNTADSSGGGIANLGGSFRIERTTVSNNIAVNGGGVSSEDAFTAMTSTVSGNVADSGGGVVIAQGTGNLAMSTISGNTGSGSGGGVLTKGVLDVGLSTITANSSSIGAGLEIGGPGTANIAGTILAANTGPDCTGTPTTGGYNIDSDGTCLPVPGAGDQAGIDPQLDPLGDNGGPTETHLPQADSPAIDMIPASTGCEDLYTDQRGEPRLVGPACDVGSVETQHVLGSMHAFGANASGQIATPPAPKQVGAANGWATVSSAGDHAAAIRTDGTLWTWGRNGDGELGFGDTNPRPAPTQLGTDTDWATVAAGESYTLAVKTDGTLWAWGMNIATGLGYSCTTLTCGDTLVPTQVGTDTDWATVAAGVQLALGIKTDGTLWEWGCATTFCTSTPTPTQVGTDTNWATISAGGNYFGTHRLATKTNGTLWAWGPNTNGRTGLGTTAGITAAPTQVGSATNWATADAGFTHSLATRTDGTLWAWGANSNGRTGLGTTTGETLVPTQVGSATNWAAASAGAHHSVGVRSDGTLWAWGDNQHGRTGLGVTFGNTLSPTQVGTDTDWASAVAIDGQDDPMVVTNSLGTRSGGTLWGWAADFPAPTTVGTDTDWVQISAGEQYTLALKSDGTLWAWGDNGNGRTGLGTDVGSTLTPTQVGVANDWAAISAGAFHAAAVKANGTLWTWGSNVYGQTGFGVTTGSTLVPTQVGSATDWAAVSAGQNHNLAVKADGTLWSWGYNLYGRTGHGVSAGNTTTPTQVGTDTDWAEVSAGGHHSLALRADGTLWSWGFNSDGRTGLGTDVGNTLTPTQVGTDTNWVQVVAGGYHSLALKADRTLWSWGWNFNGRTGLGTDTGGTLVPTQVGTDADWFAISSSSGGQSGHSFALKADGTGWGFGLNTNGQLGNDDPVDQWSPVQIVGAASWAALAAGEDHSVGIARS